jgi:hypothetical protein
VSEKLVYLATPYSHPEWEVKKHRYRMACSMAASLMEQGYLVFCPIAHSHPIETYGMPELKSGDWWLRQDFAILKHCDELLVYKMDGWAISYGVGKEIAFANEHLIPIRYIDSTEHVKQLELF